MVRSKLKSAFTLIEVLIVVSIIAILAIALFLSMRNQRQKGEDARVKTELERLKIAFEDYYGDNNCYPPEEWFDEASDCGSANLSPYLSTITCDRKTGTPYRLEKDPTGCSWYILYATLQTGSDPSYATYYNSSGDELLGTYAVSSSNAPLEATSVPINPDSTYYWCSGLNNCTTYDPNLFTCTPSYTDDPNCANSGCPLAGSCVAR